MDAWHIETRPVPEQDLDDPRHRILKRLDEQKNQVRSTMRRLEDLGQDTFDLWCDLADLEFDMEKLKAGSV